MGAWSLTRSRLLGTDSPRSGRNPAEVIVRRLACHAAPSDTAVFDEELRVTLATARTVPSLAQNR